MSHLNTFWKDAPDKQLTTFGSDSVKLAEQLRSVQDYFTKSADGAASRFEKCHVPALTTLTVPRRAKNVILVR
jgi:hypothetical protein